MNETRKPIGILQQFGSVDRESIDDLLRKEAAEYPGKIVVLDDDPTGIQTVHGISVYTSWDRESIRQGFQEEKKLFFILTNSRGLTKDQTALVHREIAQNVHAAAVEFGCDYLVISRSDSTLRGHFPLETELLCKERERLEKIRMDGEILCPYFREGGRFTVGNIHYVRYGGELVPAAETEFAKDGTFGYGSSDLTEYVEEKTGGNYRKEDCLCFSVEELRRCDFDELVKKLVSVSDFRKVIVNAVEDCDVKIFAVVLYRALKAGKHYILRSAAALVKAVGAVPDQPLLAREHLIREQVHTGGVIVVGSHTNKTTEQLEELQRNGQIHFIEMNSDLVLEEGALDKEVDRILVEEEQYLAQGVSVCVSTKRTVLRLESDTPQDALLRSVKISDALQQCVGRLRTVPAFVVAKGGITSSDVGTKALCVKCACAAGQIQPGIPVWRLGQESRFPGIPYVIFPGNVGERGTLRTVVETLL